MWSLSLYCNGCGASGGSDEIEKGDSYHDAKEYLRDDAETRGWDRTRSPDDGEIWHCAVCAAARSGRPLVAATSGGKGAANG